MIQDNFLCKTERDSLTNQMNMFNKISQMNQINLTRGMSLSKLLNEPSNTKGRSNMGLNKNLHMKSSISKKLLKAFKVTKNGNYLKSTFQPQACINIYFIVNDKHDENRKSLQYTDISRKFSNERLANSSVPEYLRTQYISQKDKSSKK